MDHFFYSVNVDAVSKLTLARVNNLPDVIPKFRMDRDQIFYSRAFRRLAGKTQLFAAGQDELLRNRLTHTLEVSQIARAIAEALHLDLDLVEAMVLGHDLGHTPFGHVGERTLHKIMTPDPHHILGTGCPLNGDTETLGHKYSQFLGFKHNLQSLVVAMELEKNASGRGLNLTEYTLYGIQTHTKPKYSENPQKTHDMLGYYRDYLDEGCSINGQPAWSLEAQLVAQADEIAQLHHDLEDILLEGLATPKEIAELLKPMLAFRGSLSAEELQVLNHPDSFDLETFTYAFTRIVVELLMNQLAETANERIIQLGGKKTVNVKSRNAASGQKKASRLRESKAECKGIFSYGDKSRAGSFAAAADALSKKITGTIRGEASILNADAKGEETIQNLFRVYYRQPSNLPDECIFAFFGAYCSLKKEAEAQVTCRSEFRNMTEKELRDLAYTQGMDKVRARFEQVFQERGQTTDAEELLLMRTICNHIASMTDSGARKIYQDFYA